MRILILFISVLTFGSCSMKKLYETKQYNAAMQRASMKLKRIPNHYEAQNILKQAYFEGTEIELEKIKTYEKQNPPNWLSIIKSYETIEDLQKYIFRLDSSKHFEGIENYLSQKEMTKKIAITSYFETSKALLNTSPTKENYQLATNLLKQALAIDSTFGEAKQLLQLTQQKGAKHILFEVKNPQNFELPPSFYVTLKDIEFGKYNSEWRKFHTQYEPGKIYDYTLQIELTQFSLSNKRINGLFYFDRKELFDSLSNKTLVRAKVTKQIINKSLYLKGEVQLIDNFTMNTFKKLPTMAHEYWKAESAIFEGDERALSVDSKILVNLRENDFASFEQASINAAKQFKDDVDTYLFYLLEVFKKNKLFE